MNSVGNSSSTTAQSSLSQVPGASLDSLQNHYGGHLDTLVENGPDSAISKPVDKSKLVSDPLFDFHGQIESVNERLEKREEDGFVKDVKMVFDKFSKIPIPLKFAVNSTDLKAQEQSLGLGDKSEF